MSRIGMIPSNAYDLRVLRASKGGNRPACVESHATASRAPNNTRDADDAVLKERRVSLNSKQTLQLLNRAAAAETLRAATPPRRYQGVRLYAGPTVRTAGTWEARFDSPGPQAYNEGDKWREKFRNVPSTCIDIAKCARHMPVLTKPGPGDYNIAHHSVGDNPGGIKFGTLAPGKKYPPRTPDHPRAEIPCSYAEPEHVSCLHHQSTSDRTTSPTVFFGGAPRFQEVPRSRDVSLERSSGPTSITKSRPTRGTRASTTRSVTAASSRRGKKRKKRRRGGPRIFRRGDYGWLTSCVESKPWEPKLKLLDGRNSYDGNEHGDSFTSTLDASRSRSLTEKNAPRPVLRRGERCNQSEYNPQHRDLPREKDRYPGPKYGRPPGAFGRTGGSGGTAAPSASVSSLDRFPRGRLFSEEEVREREATPGPEAYDVGLEHRLEGHSLEMMQGLLKTLESWGSLGVGRADDWPFAGSNKSGRAPAAASEFSQGDKVRQSIRSNEAGDEMKRETPSKGGENGEEVAEEEKEERNSETELLEGVAKRTIFGRSRTPCFAGGSAAPEDLQTSKSSSPTAKISAKEINCKHRTAERHCSRLFPASSAAARRGVPCSECLRVEVAAAASSFVAAAASVSDANLFRRARTTGASVRFGDMPRQRSAPAFSIGRGQRDVTSRLLHTTPAETIYREARLGRSGKGPITACPRAGDALARPRTTAARVILPSCSPDGSRGRLQPGDGRSGVDTAAGGEAAEKGLVVVDGALGPQVKSCRPTSPSFTLAGPRRAATLFHERLRYGGQVLLAEQECQAQSREFFDTHIPTIPTANSAQ